MALRRAVDMNVTSFMYLTGLFVKAFGATRPDLPHDQLPPAQLSSFGGRAVVVNVSSLAAIQAFASWGVYCTGGGGDGLDLELGHGAEGWCACVCWCGRQGGAGHVPAGGG